MILQITFFKICRECIENENTLFTLMKDFVLPLILTSASIYGAYYIFIIETKRNRNAELKKEIEQTNQRNSYLSNIIYRTINSTEINVNSIKKLVKDIEGDKLTFHLPKLLPLEDLKRLYNILLNENYIHSYIEEFKDENKSSIKEINQIIASSDFLFSSFNGLMDQFEKSQKFDYERKIKLQALQQKAFDISGLIYMNLEKSKHPALNKFAYIANSFETNHKEQNSNFEFYEQYFSNPFFEFSIQYLEQHNDENNPYFLELSRNTRHCLELIREIRNESNLSITNLNEQIINIEKVIAELIDETKKLKNKYNFS